LNLPHYPDHATVILTEPSRTMRHRLLLRLGAYRAREIGSDSFNGNSFELAAAALEQMPFADCTFDTVVCTLVLCSVRDLRLALKEIHRVLKRDGRFLFVEHVAAENHPGRLKWQRRVEPMWKFLGGNCHLTRRTEQAILEAGFRMELVEQAGVSGAALAQPMIRGEAVKEDC